jgi:predicted aspartyl protease
MMRAGVFVAVVVGLGAVACIARVSPPAAREVEPGEVRFELAGAGDTAVIVPVTINGQGAYPFVVDTGATLTCVDEELAKTLELPQATGAVGFGATLRGGGAIRLVTIKSLQVGSAKGEDLMACTIDLQALRGAGIEARGLLGLNFLKAHRVTFDFAAETLRLDAPSSAAQ